MWKIYPKNVVFLKPLVYRGDMEAYFSQKKIPHTGDIESLDRCGQQHRCHSRVDQEQTKTKKNLKTEKIVQNVKTQKRVEIGQNLGSHPEKKADQLWNSSVRGGGVLTQSITFEAHFCASRVKVFLLKIEGFRHFWAFFLKQIILKIATLGVFGKFYFSPSW